MKKQDLTYLLSFLNPQEEGYPLVCKYWYDIAKDIQDNEGAVSTAAPTLKWYAHLTKLDIVHMKAEIESFQTQAQRQHSKDHLMPSTGKDRNSSLAGSDGGRTDLHSTTKPSSSNEMSQSKLGKNRIIVSDYSSSSSSSSASEVDKKDNKGHDEDRKKAGKDDEDDEEKLHRRKERRNSKKKAAKKAAEAEAAAAAVLKTQSKDSIHNVPQAKGSRAVVQVSLDNIPSGTADPDVIMRKTTVFSPGVNRNKVAPNDMPQAHPSPGGDLPRPNQALDPSQQAQPPLPPTRTHKSKSKKIDPKRKEDQLLQNVKDIRSEQQLIALLEYISAGYTKMDGLLLEKRRIKKLIKAWNATFLKSTGHLPSSEDRKGHLRELHEEYQQVNRILSLSIVFRILTLFTVDK